MDRCRTDLPPRFEIGNGRHHWAACWLYDMSDLDSPAVFGEAGE